MLQRPDTHDGRLFFFLSIEGLLLSCEYLAGWWRFSARGETILHPCILMIPDEVHLTVA